MKFRHLAAQFFRNAADYFEPQGIHPSPLDKELRRQSQGNFTGRELTAVEIAHRQKIWAQKEIEEFKEIMHQLKGKEKTPTI